MRAVVIDRFGPPDVLVPRTTPDPSPGRGQVLLDVAVANVTFVETQVRAGTPPSPAMLPALPAVLGNGVGGTVSAVGDGVDAASVGRTVVAGLDGTGGYAEQATADVDHLVHVPDGLALADAVALLADGRTALALVDAAAPRAGDVVVVEAAAGGVGTLLTQLAVAAGARVVALAGGPRKLAVARDLGAEVAIDYREEGWADRVRDAVGSVDVVFDGVGGSVAGAAFGLLGPGGRFCPFGLASGTWAPVTAEDARAAGVEVRRPSTPPDRLPALSARALDLAAAGQLRPVVGQRHELADAAAAHAAIEGRATIGKTLLEVR